MNKYTISNNRAKLSDGDDALTKGTSSSTTKPDTCESEVYPVTEEYAHGNVRWYEVSSMTEPYMYATLEDSDLSSITEPYIYGTLEENEIRIFWMQMSEKFEEEIVGILETITLDQRSLFTNDRQYKRSSYKNDKEYTYVS